MIMPFLRLLSLDRQVQKLTVSLVIASAAVISLWGVNGAHSRRLVVLRAQMRPKLMQRDLSFLSGKLLLKGIVVDREEPIAVINDIVVRTGDEVGYGVRIIRIEQARVTVGDGLNFFDLILPEDVVNEKSMK